MKKLIFSVLILGATMISCSSDDAVISESAASAIQTYVDNNYPDATIMSKVNENSTITATLNTGEAITFTTSGTVVSYSNNSEYGMKADSLGLTTTDSIHIDSIAGGRHGHDGDKSGGRGGKGGHGDKGGKGGKGGHGDKGTKDGSGRGDHGLNSISIDSLSTTINTYISTNYAGFTVLHAEVDTICQGVVTEVLVSSSSQEPIKLVFDAAGTYLLKAERALYSNVPTEVSTAVTTNYSTYTVMTRGEIFTMADNSLEYKVYLSLSGTRKMVTFKADGSVLCEK